MLVLSLQTFDVGGTADAKRVETAFRIILKDPNVKAILINIFGGIVRCDRVAQGVVDAYKNMGDAISANHCSFTRY
jgi:succinyl-CoA synthetase beta subunit